MKEETITLEDKRIALWNKVQAAYCELVQRITIFAAAKQYNLQRVWLSVDLHLADQYNPYTKFNVRAAKNYYNHTKAEFDRFELWYNYEQNEKMKQRLVDLSSLCADAYTDSFQAQMEAAQAAKVAKEAAKKYNNLCKERSEIRAKLGIS